MRNSSPVVTLATMLLISGGMAPGYARQQDQVVPDAPQPQKKQAAKPQAAPTAPAPPSTQPPAKDDNPFPETVSRDAAKAATDAARPDDAPADSKAAPAHPSADDNPFPEDVSRSAARRAGDDTTPAPAPAAKSDVPSGVSSSSQSGSLALDDPGSPAQDVNPARASKDAEIGGFYLKTGNYPGALLRYQDAAAADPTNVAAIFGLAEAQHMLGKDADAEKSYQLYLDIVPNGPRAKEALKALKTLQRGK